MVNTADFIICTTKRTGGATERDIKFFRTAKYYLKTSSMGMEIA